MANLLQHPKADLYIPDDLPPEQAMTRVTHLGVGAHQDDLEFMALHGILECHGRDGRWFGGITCTDGSGCARTGPYANVSGEEMRRIRAEEQRQAARIGQYAFVAQLGYPSSAVKDPCRSGHVDDLVRLLEMTLPKVVYTHNPADKHGTHVAIVAALIMAIRRLPVEQRPRQVIGCEGWRDLDWLADGRKIVMDVSSGPELAQELGAVFKSQIAGGKRYDLAVEGRRRANATFLDSHAVDKSERVCIGIDLSPLIRRDDLSPSDYVLGMIREFGQDVEAQLGKFF